MSNPIIENAIFESKLIDLFSKIDISEVETDIRTKILKS